MAVRIGELLLKEKRITPEQLQQALNHQKANGGKLGHNLVRLGFVRDEDITALLSRQYGVPSPYLWSGTNVYTRGKFVRDGVYDPNAVSAQIGAVALLKRMAALGIE